MAKPLAKSLALLVLLAAFSVAGAEIEPQPLEAVPRLDLSKYQGRWYEIARKPNRFQKACAGDVLVQYGLRDDGRVDVYNQCSEEDGDLRSASGVARIAEPGTETSKLEVRFAPAFLSFLPMVWADYWVIDLDPDYRWAVVGEPDREYFWILSRTPSLPDDTLQAIQARARAQGYDLSDLVKTAHSSQ